MSGYDKRGEGMTEETMQTPQMNWNATLENLKTMAFGEQAFERFSAKERETLDAAINVYEKSYAIEACNLDLAYENENLLEQIQEMKKNWIPINVETPKNIKPVIVTWKNNDPAAYYQDIKGKHFTGTAHYKDGKWYWYSDVTEDFLAEYGRCDIYEFDSAIEVVAWMPMPKPYETESEIEE